MRKYVVLAVLVGSCLLAGTPVLARQKREPNRQRDKAAKRSEAIGRMDANQDKQITKEECLAYFAEKAKRKAEKVFSRMDINSDGVVSADEIEKATKKSGAVKKEE